MSQWDEYASEWDDDPAARTYASAAFSSLLPILERARLRLDTARALDFGCGTGLLTEALVEQGASVVAVDTSVAMLGVLEAKIAARDWQDVRVSTELPTTPAVYELIVCSSVCSFLDDYPAMARTMVELLCPGGLFVQWDWERDDTDDDPHGFVPAEIANALADAGLEQISVHTAFEIPFEDQVMRPLMGYGFRPGHSASR